MVTRKVVIVKRDCMENFVWSGRLREERERISVSQADAALLAGVSRNMWGAYERGISAPGAEVLMRLLGHRFDVVYILGGARTLGESTLNVEEEQLLAAFRATDDAGGSVILRAAHIEATRCNSPANPYAVPAPRPAPSTLHEPSHKRRRAT